MIVYNLNPLALAASVFVFFLYLYRQYQHEQEEEEYDLIRRKKLFGKPYQHLYSESAVKSKEHLRSRPQAVIQGSGVMTNSHEAFTGQPLKSLANLSRERLDDLMAMEKEKLDYLEKYSQIAFPSQNKVEPDRLTQQKTNESFQIPKVQANVSKVSGSKVLKDSEVLAASQNGQQVPTVNYIVPTICSHCLKSHNPAKKSFKKKTVKPNVSNIIDFTDIDAFNKKDAYSSYTGFDIQKLRKSSGKDTQEQAANNLKKRPLFDFGVDMSRKGSQATDRQETDSKMPVNFAKSVTFPTMTRPTTQENPSESRLISQKPQPSLDISIIPHPSDETKTNIEKADKSTADQTNSAFNTSINLFAPKKTETVVEQPKPAQPLFQPSQTLFQPAEKKALPEVEKPSSNVPIFLQPKQEDKKLFNLSAPDNNILFKDFVIKPTDPKNLFQTPGSSHTINLNVPDIKTENKAETSETAKPKAKPLFNFTTTATEPNKTTTLFSDSETPQKTEPTSTPLFPVSTNIQAQPLFGDKIKQYKVDEKATDINFTQKPFGEDKTEPGKPLFGEVKTETAKPLFGNLNASSNLFSFANETKNIASDITPKPDAFALNSQTSLDHKEEPKGLFNFNGSQPAKDAKPSLFGPFSSTTPAETKPLFSTGDKPAETPAVTKTAETLFPAKPTTDLFGSKTETPLFSAKTEGLFGAKPTEGNLFGNNKPAETNLQGAKTDSLFSKPSEDKNAFPTSLLAPSFGNGKKSFDEENLENSAPSHQQKAPVVNPFAVSVEPKPIAPNENANPFRLDSSQVSASKISDLVSQHKHSGLFNQSPTPAGANNQQQEAKPLGNFFTGVTNLSGQQQSQGQGPLFSFNTTPPSIPNANPFIQSSPKQNPSERLFGQNQEMGSIFGGNAVPTTGLFNTSQSAFSPFGISQQNGNNQAQNTTNQPGWMGNLPAQGSTLFGNLANPMSQPFGNNNSTGGNAAPGGMNNPFFSHKNA